MAFKFDNSEQPEGEYETLPRHTLKFITYLDKDGLPCLNGPDAERYLGPVGRDFDEDYANEIGLPAWEKKIAKEMGAEDDSKPEPKAEAKPEHEKPLTKAQIKAAEKAEKERLAQEAKDAETKDGEEPNPDEGEGSEPKDGDGEPDDSKSNDGSDTGK